MGTTLAWSERWALFSRRLYESVWLLLAFRLCLCLSVLGIQILVRIAWKTEESCWEMTLACHAHCTVPSVMFSRVAEGAAFAMSTQGFRNSKAVVRFIVSPRIAGGSTVPVRPSFNRMLLLMLKVFQSEQRR